MRYSEVLQKIERRDQLLGMKIHLKLPSEICIWFQQVSSLQKTARLHSSQPFLGGTPTEDRQEDI